MKLILIISLVLNAIAIQYQEKVIAQTRSLTGNGQSIQPRTQPPSQQKPSSKQKQSPKQKPNSQPKSKSRPIFIPPKPRPGLTSISGRRSGMGSRDNCPPVPIPITALVPFKQQKNINNNTNKSIEIVEGLTTSQRPEFLFYLPYTTQNLSGSKAEFSLQDTTGTDVYREKAIALPSKPGIVSVSLPNTKSLEVGKNYRWYFKVHCNQQTAGIPIYVEGGIKRIDLDFGIKKQLGTAANSQQKAVIYAREGIWFDALNMLAQLRRSSGNPSIEEDWQSLLNSAKLDKIAASPMVN